MSTASKLISVEEASAVCRRPLVLTNGVFDILHRGHVAYLEAARELGESLLVAVNSDASVKHLGKGPARPLNGQRDRVALVAALQCVSHVVIFEEPTPYVILATLRPEVYVKGGDYDMASLEEPKMVHGWGGRALSIPLLQGYSTTALVRRISGLVGSSQR